MRRLLPAAVLALLLIALGAGVAVSSGDEPAPASSTPSAAPTPTPPADHGGRRHRGFGHGLLGVVRRQVLTSMARRLDVPEARLRTALRVTHRDARERRLAAAHLTVEDRTALRACRGGRHGRHAGRRHPLRRNARGCDSAAAREALQKLRPARGDLAAEKARIAADLAGKLGLTPEKVLEAARAELVERLGQATGLGLVTPKGQALALACFDAPAECDHKALRAEVRVPFGHGRRGRHG